MGGTFNYSYNTSETEKMTPAILSNADNKYQAIAENVSNNSSKVYINTYFQRTFDLKYANMGLTAGIRYEDKSSTGNSITMVGLPNDNIIGPVGHGRSKGTAKVSENQNTFSVIFTPNFSIKNIGSFKAGGDRYVFEPTLSPELNSVYGKRTKWNFNPSLGFRWNLGYEKFMQRFANLDRMGIRITWGQVVKYKATRYDVYGTYDVKDSYTYNGESYIPINFDKLPCAT